MALALDLETRWPVLEDEDEDFPFALEDLLEDLAAALVGAMVGKFGRSAWRVSRGVQKIKSGFRNDIRCLNNVRTKGKQSIV